MRPAPRLLFAVPFVVVAAALMIPKVTGHGESYVSVPKINLAILKNSLDRFDHDCGRYPTPWEGLKALTEPPPGLRECWKGPYSDGPVDKDYWGHPYVYWSDGTLFELTSLGEDGKPGGKGEDADLSVND